MTSIDHKPVLDNEEEDLRAAKRPKLDNEDLETGDSNNHDEPKDEPEPFESLLPPSRVLLGQDASWKGTASANGHFGEFDVGISEYISGDLPPIHAIIKQRQVQPSIKWVYHLLSS